MPFLPCQPIFSKINPFCARKKGRRGAVRHRASSRSFSKIRSNGLFRFGDIDDDFAVQRAALGANPTVHLVFTALAEFKSGSGELGIVGASGISSCTRYFFLRYCHGKHLPERSQYHYLFIIHIFFYLSSSFARIAKRGSTSFFSAQWQGPSLRSLPQEGQSPLQSSLQR